MKITKVEGFHLRLPVVEERCDGTQDAFIVRIHTDDGLVGIGEVDSSPHVMKAIYEAPMSHTLCYGLSRLLLGENPLDVERLWDKMYRGTIYYGRQGAAIQAISGADIALWDILGQATGQPVYALLGGARRTHLRPYGSVLFGETPEETARIGASLVEQGFTAVKFGWGPFGQSEAGDIAFARAAREGLGDEADLIIDVGWAWDVKTAIRRVRRLSEYRPAFIEEPLPADDWDGYARLTDAVDIPIAAGEEECGRLAFRDFMDRARIDIVQPDVTRAGGITEMKRIARDAADRRRIVINHSFTTYINIAASLHVLATLPEAPFLEYSMAPSAIREEMTHETFPVENGLVALPQGPGLGVHLDEEVLRRYLVEETVAE
ncbi:MAG: mandelate racemase/muconate lactonizing enzyme family protein [Armatimonadetes bacterium]|nr:mandelate racemase/muconate lactonizing enzyme family protein [Armatimonadota bacterium]